MKYFLRSMLWAAGRDFYKMLKVAAPIYLPLIVLYLVFMHRA